MLLAVLEHFGGEGVQQQIKDSWVVGPAMAFLQLYLSTLLILIMVRLRGVAHHVVVTAVYEDLAVTKTYTRFLLLSYVLLHDGNVHDVVSS